jgi:hypothetical protein
MARKKFGKMVASSKRSIRVSHAGEAHPTVEVIEARLQVTQKSFWPLLKAGVYDPKEVAA